jgi:6-phosphogluconolactonase
MRNGRVADTFQKARADTCATTGGEMGVPNWNFLKACVRIAPGIMVTAFVAITAMGPQKAHAEAPQTASSYFLYAGGEGINQYRFDPKTGTMTSMGVAAQVSGESWLTTDPQHRYLYTIGAPASAPNQVDLRGGSVSAFSIDPGTGALTYLNSVPSKGIAHISLDNTGKILLAANYGSGSVSSFAIKDDGSIGLKTSLDQHTGSSVNPARQTKPHPHSVVVSLDNRFVFAPDLGLDKIFIYKIDTAKQTITPNNPAYVKVKPGLGPRHFTFGANGKFAYVLCEMGSGVVTLAYDAARGIVTPIQTSSILPPNPTPEDQGSEIRMAASGRYLYTSNQGSEDHPDLADGYLTVFQVDGKTGMVKQLQVQPTSGKQVRSFAIDPTGKYLLAGNGGSNTVREFAIGTDGKLTATGQNINVSSPSSFLFIPAP